MKIGMREYVITPHREHIERGQIQGARVLLEVFMWGGRVASESIEPASAREFAAQLLQAANEAEGRK